jgi:hypothetical protein
MTTEKPKKTHQEYLAIARVLGSHIAAELITEPIGRAAAMATHFLFDRPICPMCLEQQAERVKKEVPK